MRIRSPRALPTPLGGEAVGGDAQLWELLAADRVTAAKGHERETRHSAAHALALSAALNFPWLGLYASSILGLLEFTLGQTDAAAAHLNHCAQLTAGLELQHAAALAFEPDRVEALLALGRIPEAAAATRRLDHHARPSGSPAHQAIAARCRGLTAATDAFERVICTSARHGASSLHSRSTSEPCSLVSSGQPDSSSAVQGAPARPSPIMAGDDRRRPPPSLAAVAAARSPTGSPAAPASASPSPSAPAAYFTYSA